MMPQHKVTTLESAVDSHKITIQKTIPSIRTPQFYNPIDVVQYGLALDGPKEPDTEEDLVAIIFNNKCAVAMSTPYSSTLSQEMDLQKASVFYFLVPHDRRLPAAAGGMHLTERNLMLLDTTLRKNKYETYDLEENFYKE
jgi:hypothetical protein